ncbi:LysR family transcriptional regulator substrate-binding protein [Actinomadura madurae]|uniref:LysR family transcriptional regulator substrate-binding protein n=1 Tax=Actinomadura madurae TaxID=1993 RepID=UPI0020D24C24
MVRRAGGQNPRRSGRGTGRTVQPSGPHRRRGDLRLDPAHRVTRPARDLGGFRRRYPGVRVRLREGTRQELVSMVQQDTIDLAVVSIDPLRLPHGTTGVVVDHDHLVLAGPPGHPFEHYDTAPAHALDGMDLISFRKGAGLRDAADTVLREAGVVPNIVIESNEVSVLLGLIAHGLGLGIIPRGFVALAFQPIWSIPFDPPIRPPLSLIWRESRHLAPAADAFLHHIKTSTPE